MKIQRVPVRFPPPRNQGRRYYEDDDDDDQQYKRKEPGGAEDCCCSCSQIAPFIVTGLLVCVTGIGLALTILFLKPEGTTSTSSTVSVEPNSASTTATNGSSSSSSASTTLASSSSMSSSSTASLSTNATTMFMTNITKTTTTASRTTTTTSTTTTAPYCLTRVTFDDIVNQSSTSGVVPNGYYNLNWTNVQYLNVSTMPTSGYETVVQSLPYVAFSPGGSMVTIKSANGTRFFFNSVVVSSAWRDNLTWTIYMYRNNTGIAAGSFQLDVMNTSTISCGGCWNMDKIYMTASGGTPHLGLAENGTEFTFDDLCISFGY